MGDMLRAPYGFNYIILTTVLRSRYYPFPILKKRKLKQRENKSYPRSPNLHIRFCKDLFLNKAELKNIIYLGFQEIYGMGGQEDIYVLLFVIL